MDPLLVIPTYITQHRITRRTEALSSFDHTTALTQEGELKRCLTSLCGVAHISRIMVVISCDATIEDQAKEKVARIFEQFPSLPLFMVGPSEARVLVGHLAQQLDKNFDGLIGVQGYSALRNLSLVVAHLLHFDSVVFLDDDMIVQDPHFMEKAMYGLGKLTRKGIPILAKTGSFLDTKSSRKARDTNEVWNYFWRLPRAFNQWLTRAQRGPRLQRSHFVCGGCMALHKEAFSRVAFDPWIQRGEDLDYMLNLRMYGSEMWYDKAWLVHHRPPVQRNEGLRFYHDVFRWFYEYRKMEYSKTQIDLLQIKPASLNPYPGPYLESGVIRRATLTASLRLLFCKDKPGYRKALRASRSEARVYAQENCDKYFGFQYMWPSVMEFVEKNDDLHDVLVHMVDTQQHAESLKTTERSYIDPGATGEIRLSLPDNE